MQVISTKKEMRALTKTWQDANLIVGFVPTMGALHEGHLSLVRHSRRICDKTVVSVFVNPKQFNDWDDYVKYPRCLEQDVEMLERDHVDAVFAPTEQEFYPRGFDTTTTVIPYIGPDTIHLEADFRSGHFDGVLTVGVKLFSCTNADKAFLGEKDYDQGRFWRDI